MMIGLNDVPLPGVENDGGIRTNNKIKQDVALDDLDSEISDNDLMTEPPQMQQETMIVHDTGEVTKRSTFSKMAKDNAFGAKTGLESFHGERFS